MALESLLTPVTFRQGLCGIQDLEKPGDRVLKCTCFGTSMSLHAVQVFAYVSSLLIDLFQFLSYAGCSLLLWILCHQARF